MDNASSQYIGEVDTDLRLKAQQLLAAETGLRLHKTLVPAGDSLLPEGEAKLRRMEAGIAALPDFTVGAEALAMRIHAEQPKDLKGITIQSVRMNPNRAGLYGRGHDPATALGYTTTGLGHVLQFVKPPQIRNGFGENVLALPPKLRSDVFNHWANVSHRSESEAVTLRTTVSPESGGRRIIRAVTSDRHSLTTGDDSAVLTTLMKLTGSTDVFKGAKVRITREQDHSYFELVWPAMKRQIRVGDVAYIGVRVRNSETKAGSLIVESFVHQIICWNCTSIDSDDLEQDKVNLRHVGDLTERLPKLFIAALKRVDPWVKRFADAYKVPLVLTRGEMIAKVGKAFDLPEKVLTRMASGWDADGQMSAGDTLAGLVNSMTRAAQDSVMAEADVVERAAGQLANRGLQMLG